MLAVFKVMLVLLASQTETPPADAVAEEPPRYTIHVMTMDQGDELFARFGHIALVVEDRERKTMRVYNYGTFGFNDPALRWKYVRGYLTFWLSVVSYQVTLRTYHRANRGAWLRTLDLPPETAEEMVERLRENALPENREYAYRHYLDNCCTRVRDMVDDVIGGLVKKGRTGEFTGRTYRYWTRRATEGLTLSGGGIDYILGPAIDRPLNRWEEHFLPEPFSEDLDEIRIGPDQRPLVVNKQRVLERRGPAVGEVVPSWEYLSIWIPAMLLLLGLVPPLVLGRRRIARHLLGLGVFLWGFLSGLGGLTLVFMWAFTAHTDSFWNENVLVTPFTHLWLMGPGAKMLFTGRHLKPGTARLFKWYLLGALGLIALDVLLKLGPFIQDNWRFILIAVVANGLVLGSLFRTSKPDGD